MGVHKSTPIPAMMGDMGWVDIEIKQSLSMIRYWNRFLDMDNTRLTKRVFLWDYDQRNQSWCNEVLKIFTSIDLHDIYRYKLTCDISIIEMKLMTNLEKQWRIDMKKMPKLRTYVLYKDVYAPESYIIKCMSRRRRSLMAQLRIGIEMLIGIEMVLDYTSNRN